MQSIVKFLVITGLVLGVGCSAVAQDKPAAPAAADGAKMAKPDLAKGEALYGAVCAACHGADGNSAIAANPSLAQQHPEYLIKQLTEFKSGKRASAVMQGMASTLVTAEDVRNVAYWITSKSAKGSTAKDKALVTAGEKLYRGGSLDRQIAACSGCHSPTGAGIPAQYPRLSGQQTEYTVAQLVAFRDGARTNNPTMADVAAKLSDKDIKAVAEYIAGLR